MDTSNDLQMLSSKTVLLDQSNRIEKHRANFETLKGEYLNLQQMHDQLKDENSELSRNYHNIVTKSEDLIRKLQQERDSKIVECEQLRTQVITPFQLSELKEGVSNDMENIYRKQVEALEMELHVLKDDHKKIRRCYEFLKADFESSEVEYESKIKAMKQHHQNEILDYRRQCKELSSHLVKDIPGEIQRVRQLQKENTQLNERVKQLMNENEHIRAQLEHTDSLKGQQHLGLKQHLSELQATIDQLSNDKTSLSCQMKHLQNELESHIKEQQSLSQQLLESQREANQLKRKYDDALHQHEREMDDMKRKSLREVQSYQDDRRKYIDEIEQYKIHCETLEISIKQLEGVMSNKDKELSIAIEEAVKTEWQRRVDIEKEKVIIEDRLIEAQRIAFVRSQECDQTVSDLQEQVTELQTEKSLSDKEIESLKEELQQQKTLCMQLNKDQAELKELRNKTTVLTVEKNSLEESNRMMDEEQEKLLTKIQILTQQLESVQVEMDQLQDRHSKEMDRFRSELDEERLTWKQRFDECSSQKKKTEEKLHSLKKKKTKLQQQHERSLQEIQKLLELAHSNEKEALIEKEKIRKSSDDDIKSLKRQLKAMKQQHQQFLLLLSSSPDNIQISQHHLHPLDNESSVFSLERDQ